MGSLLMSPAAQKIDFTLDGFHVDGAGLMFVAIALLSKPHGKHGFEIRIGDVPPDSEATYDPAINTFDFPSEHYGTTPYERMSIIHECIHARRDTHGKKIPTSLGRVTTRAVTDEAAAFLGEALFHIYDTTPTGAVPQTPTWATGSDIVGLAHGVAVRIFTHAPPYGMDVYMPFGPALIPFRKDIVVDPHHGKVLRDAVMKHPVYKPMKKNPKETYDNNGVSL